MDRCNTLAKTLLVQTSFIAWGQLVFYLWICKSVFSGCAKKNPWWFWASSMNNWDPSKKPQISMPVKTPSLVEVGLFTVDSRMSKCVMQNFGRFVICLLLMRMFLFLQLSPAIIVFLFVCFMLSKAHFNSIHYITQMTFKDFQTLPKKTITSQGPWNKSTNVPPKKNGGKPKPTKPTVVFFCQFFQVAQSFRQQARDLGRRKTQRSWWFFEGVGSLWISACEGCRMWKMVFFPHVYSFRSKNEYKELHVSSASCCSC